MKIANNSHLRILLRRRFYIIDCHNAALQVKGCQFVHDTKTSVDPTTKKRSRRIIPEVFDGTAKFHSFRSFRRAEQFGRENSPAPFKVESVEMVKHLPVPQQTSIRKVPLKQRTDTMAFHQRHMYSHVEYLAINDYNLNVNYKPLERAILAHRHAVQRENPYRRN